MLSGAAPPPIPGKTIDPPPVEVPNYAEKLDRTKVGGVAYRAFRRYSYSNVGLLANGTAYFLILSLFSVLAFAYGVITIIGADRLAEVLTDALTEALPGLVGENGIDPEVLRKTGLAAGAVGLVFLLYGGLGSVAAAGSSLHLIFGAPPDPRTFVKAKARQLLVLVVAGVLIMLSFAGIGLTGSLLGPVMDAIGLGSGLARVGVGIAGLLVSFALDVFILWLLLGWLGGIRPEPRPRLIASLIGAVMIGLIKALVSVIISWVIAKPQYGAFAAPLAVLFVFALLSQALYVSAAIAAGISDVNRPLEDLLPTVEETEDLAEDAERDAGSDADQGTDAEPSGDGDDAGSADAGSATDTDSGKDSGSSADTDSSGDTDSSTDTGSGADTGSGEDADSAADDGSGGDTRASADVGSSGKAPSSAGVDFTAHADPVADDARPRPGV